MSDLNLIWTKLNLALDNQTSKGKYNIKLQYRTGNLNNSTCMSRFNHAQIT